MDEALPIELSLRKPLLFLHVPKAAGTSVVRYLAQRVPGGFLRGLSHIPGAGPANRASIGKYLCYYGHVFHRFVDKFPSRPAVVTIIREPIDRVLSNYYFWHDRTPAHWKQQRAPEETVRASALSLREFLQEPWIVDSNFGNMATAMLRGGKQKTPHLDQHDLERAKRNLSECAVVGLTDRMDDFLTLLSHTFCWSLPDQSGARHNTTSKREPISALDADIVDRLRELTALDAELYKHAQTLFARQWQAMQDRLARQPEWPTRTLYQYPALKWLRVRSVYRRTLQKAARYMQHARA